MTTQNYLVIENNAVTNVVVWDGNTESWTPPSDAVMLILETTPAMVWERTKVNDVITWNLGEQMGLGCVGYTWDGTVLTTNQPQPDITTV
jgi:hypothetical protein